jgi:excinuclease UvrABC nuclease subunit
MLAAAEALDFEKAATLRDVLLALEKVQLAPAKDPAKAEVRHAV